MKYRLPTEEMSVRPKLTHDIASLTIVEHHARERLPEFLFGKTGCVVGMPPSDNDNKEVRCNGAQSCDGGDWPHLFRGVLLER